MRDGDEDKPVSGLPAVPEAFRGLLLTHPLEATIVKVGEARTVQGGGLLLRVTLDVGKKDGVIEGTQMRLVDDGAWNLLKIDKVDWDTSEGTLSHHGQASATPAVGWKFTSRVWN
jgi:hypothetical protein